MALVLSSDNQKSLEFPGYREVRAASTAPRQNSRVFHFGGCHEFARNFLHFR